VQIDEPAIIEALPLQPEKQAEYWHHATNAFRRTIQGIPDDTIIWSHACYSKFDNDELITAWNDMGFQALLVEGSKIFEDEISRTSLEKLIRKADFIVVPGSDNSHSPHPSKVISIKKQVLWNYGITNNPYTTATTSDCGFRTRKMCEVEKKISAMVKGRDRALSHIRQ
jgi:5-methyltetrahydropteroyltriglutamate--homocysteine methyltransferase